jgi:glycosyltransferase involved in cell wall biosynthesis
VSNPEPQKRKPSPFKSPVRWVLQKWLEAEDWQAGKLHQYDPVPLTAPFEQIPPGKAIHSPSIAVVVPSYNQGEYISATLKSIFDQHYDALQIALVDGGSDDGTPNLLKPFEKKFSYYRSRPDKGQAAAINEGFSQITGEICAWLNSDDLFLPGTLRRVADYFGKNPDVDAIYGHRLVIDPDGGEIGRWILPPHRNGDLQWFDWVPQETLFFRRSLWEKVGGLDPSFSFAMDWDLLVRFIEAKARIVRLPFLMGAFRVHDRQKSIRLNETVGREEKLRIRTRIHGQIPPEKALNQKYLNYRLRAGIYARLYRRNIFL